jgi:hypothetical protein
MVREYKTNLPGQEVIARAKKFFAERVPHYGAYLESEGASYATFRGQGGEEIAIAVVEGGPGTRVRASSPMYEQAIGRFFSTLPALGQDD